MKEVEKTAPEYSFYVTAKEYCQYHQLELQNNMPERRYLIEGKHYEQAQGLCDVYAAIYNAIICDAGKYKRYRIQKSYDRYKGYQYDNIINSNSDLPSICAVVDKIKLADRRVLKEFRLNAKQYIPPDGDSPIIGPHGITIDYFCEAKNNNRRDFINVGLRKSNNIYCKDIRAYEFEQLLVNEIAEKLNDIYKSEKPDLELYKRLSIIANGLSKAGAPLPSKHVGLYLRAVIDGGKINKLYNENSTWYKANKDKANIEDLKKKLDASIGPKGSFWKSMTGLAKVGYRNIKHILNTRRNRKLGQKQEVSK